MKFKSVILTIASLVTLSACGPSNEEKAQEMAANYLKGVLFHFDSYEPLETIVDSSFVSLATDEEAIELTLNMLQLIHTANEYSDEIKKAERSMELWQPRGYSTAFSDGEYRRAKEERDKNQQLFDKTTERIQNQFSKIKNRQKSLEIGTFDGWKVYHKFKSLNGSGTISLPGEYIFICDKDFNQGSAFPKENYDNIAKIMTAISSSEDISEMIENVDDEIY